MSDLVDLTIVKHFPKAIDCVNGHLGPEEVTQEQELDDDRYRDIQVTRCGHCHMPLRSEYDD